MDTARRGVGVLELRKRQQLSGMLGQEAKWKGTGQWIWAKTRGTCRGRSKDEWSGSDQEEGIEQGRHQG